MPTKGGRGAGRAWGPTPVPGARGAVRRWEPTAVGGARAAESRCDGALLTAVDAAMPCRHLQTGRFRADLGCGLQYVAPRREADMMRVRNAAAVVAVAVATVVAGTAVAVPASA